MTGKYYNELEVGMKFKHAGRTVTEMDNVLFSALTMNSQPLHVNEDYASKTEFGQRLVNGVFTFGLVVGLTVPDLTEGTIVANLGYDKVVHPHPVFHGDTIYAESEIIEMREFKVETQRRNRADQMLGQEARRYNCGRVREDGDVSEEELATETQSRGDF